MLAVLSEWQRGAVAVAFASAAGSTGETCPRLYRVLAACVGARAGESLLALSPAERQSVIDAVADRRVQITPVDVHASWLRGTAGSWAGAQARAGVAGRAARWLARARHANLVAMPEGPAPALSAMTIRDLPRCTEAALTGALTEFGARQLAWALHAAHARQSSSGRDGELAHEFAMIASQLPPAVGARLAAHLVRLRAGPTPTTWGSQRAALARLSGLTPSRGDTLVRLAARALAPGVAQAGGDLSRQIAQRLSRAIGAVVLAELGGPFRSVDVAQVPSWAAFLDCINDG